MPQAKGQCPECGAEVISRCGEVNAWHWAHVKTTDCDFSNKQETAWHKAWKSLFAINSVEVRLSTGKIADVQLVSNLILEFQNSRISTSDIFKYEDNRENMIWIFNGKTFCNNLVLNSKNGGYSTYRWRWFPRSLKSCWSPIYLDLDGDSKRIFAIGKMHGRYGWGNLMTRNVFFNSVLKMQYNFMDLPTLEWNLSQKGLDQYKTQSKWNHL